MRLSVIIPAYNEEKRIRPTLKDYLSHMGALYGTDFEIIVVCDGTDRTAGIVSKIGKNHKEVRLLEFRHRLGKGGALVKGFKAARGSYIGFVDADNAVTPGEFQKLVKALQASKADGVIGSRRVKSAKILGKQPLIRQKASEMFNLLVRGLCELDFKDTQCGAKVFKKEALMDVLPELKSGGFEFDVELLWRLKEKNYVVHEAPVKWRHKGKPKFKLTQAVRMLKGILEFRTSKFRARAKKKFV